jgi:hypothetical protein
MLSRKCRPVCASDLAAIRPATGGLPAIKNFEERKPGDKDMRVVYIEPRVIVSPFPLDEQPIETAGVRRPLRMTSAGSED